MKKILCLLILISILPSIALAQTLGISSTSSGVILTGTPYLNVNLVNQNPLQADPGAYVDLYFKVENSGTDSAQSVTLQLIPEYPFSLDPGVNAVQELGTIPGLQNGNNAFFARYKVKVDKDALNGDNEIKLKYSEGSATSYYTETFNISVTNPRTDFDVVAQDQSTLAIANIGANTAQSVIVRIPSQPNYRVNGTSATIIGNLNAGDYTLATFQILSTRASNISSNVSNVPSSGPSDLTVEISYTDTLGIRRTVDKNVSYEFSTSSITGRTFTRTSQSLLPISNGILYIIIGVVGIVVIVIFIKIRSRKKK
jgi:hypothetical protein